MSARIIAKIEAPPVGASFISSWPGRSGNQIGVVAEGPADPDGLNAAAKALHDRMGEIGHHALDAWLECGDRVVGYCQLGYMDHREVLRRLEITT
tara:strand:- start:1252 stop:1536 length:285 start_codon:yes stop_codon:yes gene_type:complete